ncbi:MAG: ScpA family protein [Sphingomonadales bacterium]
MSEETVPFTADFLDPGDLDEGERLVLNIDGFEGPLDVLLVLARAQKVDLAQISILELVEQYLDFMTQARRLKLELAADYLVMAAWLAYLKSRLLLPEEDEEDGLTAEELAARLQLQLQRLNAMREAGAVLMSRNRVGRDVFLRGNPEGIKILKKSAYDVTLYELLKGYADQRVRTAGGFLRIEPRPVYSLDEALRRLSKLIGNAIDWTVLSDFLPRSKKGSRYRRSTVASMFLAGLELAREGKAELRQLETWGPLYMRRKDREGG